MASAVALEDTVLAVITASTFKANLGGAKSFVMALVKTQLKNLRSVYKVYIKRPRSFQNHANLAQTCVDTLRIHFRQVKYKGDQKKLKKTIDDSIVAMEGLTDAARLVDDRRENAINDDEEFKGWG